MLTAAAEREVEEAADVLMTAAEQDTLPAPAPAPQPAEAGASGQVQDPPQSAAASSASEAGTDEWADAMTSLPAVADTLLETPEPLTPEDLIPLPTSRNHSSAPTARLQLCP